MIVSEACSGCGSTRFVVETVRAHGTVFELGGRVVDRGVEERLSDVRCAECGRVAKARSDMTDEEAAMLLEPEEPGGQ